MVKSSILRFVIGSTLSFLIASVQAQVAGEHTLWYSSDAGNIFTNALPIGNGNLGGMVYGAIAKDRIGLNECTIWSGNPGNNNKAGASNSLAQARSQIFAQNFAGADATVSGMIGGGQAAYQTAGNLFLNFTGHVASNYYRELNLKTAIAKTTYNYDGAIYTREYFASYPDQVIVVRLTCNQPGKITFSATMDSPQTPVSFSASNNNTLIMNGQADAIRFQARAKLVNEGGTVSSANSSVTVTGANSATVYVSIGTNYKAYNDVSGDQVAKAAAVINNLGTKTYSQVQTAHLADYQALFNRVDLDLGTPHSSSAQTTDRRVAGFGTSNDPSLVKLHYQFGRYLMISCSRKGSQPANLQGVWNESMNPTWGSKYTVNINTQMNYWMVESGNLPECLEPLTEKTKALVAPGSSTAQVHWGVNNGWVLHHNTDIWNRTAPIDGTWGMWPTGGAWLLQNLFEHYLFSQDQTYLASIYPTMKSSAQFFLSSMVTDPNTGYLGTCPSTSPEIQHGAYWTSFAPYMDTEIIRDLLNNTIKASQLLNQDATLRSQMQAALAKLPPFKVGRYGQLQEWVTDWDNPNDKNRHISHLYALFPSNQVSKRLTPSLAAAANVTLNQRGDDATGWSLAWKINFWARLLDGNHAYKLIQMLLTPARTYNNLFDAHPPFQIDGNFGAVSGVNEMLLQSQNNELEFLPALPTLWPKGFIKGLKARKGFLVDEIKWGSSKLSQATVTSLKGDTLRLRYGNITKTYPTKIGETYVFDASLNLAGNTTSTPYKGIAHTIPGKIQAEAYDEGGNGIAYSESNPNGNEGGATLRNDEVDLETTQDEGGGYNLAYILKDEWLKYTVNVTATGNYSVDFRLAAEGEGKVFHLEVDGVNVSGSIAVPNTGGFQTWKTITLDKVPLVQGKHVLRVVFDESYFNFNHMEFKALLTGLESKEIETKQVFPNPFTSSGLTLRHAGLFRYKITDLNSALVETGTATDTEVVGTHLLPGVYLLSIESATGKSNYKIIKH